MLVSVRVRDWEGAKRDKYCIRTCSCTCALIGPSTLLQVLSHQNWNSLGNDHQFVGGSPLIMCPLVPQRMSGVVLEDSCAEAFS